MHPTRFAGLCLLLFIAAADADYRPPVAITGVTIHNAGTEAVVGTIVLTDGHIAAVGDDVTVPHGAKVIEGDGLHAYPAFIDAFSRYGVVPYERSPEARKRFEDENPDVTQGPLAATRQANRRGIHPEYRVLDHFEPEEAARRAYHRSGFATVLVAPHHAIVAGASSLLQITETPMRRAVLAPDIAQHAGFSPGEPGGYPARILGAIASFRQFIYDAKWYGDFARYLQRHPRSPERLPADAALEAMDAHIRNGRPIVFEANTEVEIHRALDLAEEFNLRLWIAGGREAHRVIDRLRGSGVPVIASLAFGDEPDKAEAKPAAGAKRAWEPVRLRNERQRLWEEKVRNLEALLAADVLVAVSTEGCDDPATAMKNLRRAMDLGLSTGDALAALTVQPARLLGQAKHLGRIETGQFANVTLMDRPFEAADAQVKWVFVEGQPFDYTRAKQDKAKAKNKDEKNDATAESASAKNSSEGEEGKKEVEPAAPPDWLVELEADRRPAMHTGGSVLITGCTILPVGGEAIPKGSILIEQGKIAEIGSKVRKPPNIAVIDATGLFVMPGMIDCHSHMALDAVNESSLSVTAEVRVGDVIDHRQAAIYRALAGGVTTIHTMHGSTNAIGGENVILKLRYGADPAGMRFAGAPRTIKFALGENVTEKNSQRGGRRFPNSRMGVESVLRQALLSAGEYRQAHAEHAAKLSDGIDMPPWRRDLRLETLADILTGDVWVHCHGYRADEYVRLFNVAEDFGFRVAVLHHALEGYRIAAEIARHGSGVSTFASDWAYKVEAYTGIPHNAAFLARRGVSVSVNSDSPNTIRYLNLEAGECVRWGGLSERDALRLVTLNPAVQLGIDDRVGSIEVGKDGDLAIFNGHPLDSFSQCVMTLIDGEVYFQHPRPQPIQRTRTIAAAPQRAEKIASGPHALYAITHATIHPGAGTSDIEDGTVLIRNDRIERVGRDVAIPPGAVVVDAAGRHVYPGLIDAGSTLGLSEIQQVRATRDEREIARIQPELRALSAFHPFSVHIGVARGVGITTAVVRPQGGPIAGVSALFDLNGWSADEMLVREDVGLHLRVPSLPARIPSAKRADREKEHARQVDELDTFLTQAKLYARALREGADRRPPRDLRLEAMAPYVLGEKPVIFDADTYKQILDALAFAEKHGLKCVISGGQEAFKAAPTLAKKHIPVILSLPSTYPRGGFETFDSVYSAAAALDRAGVAFCFASGRASDANLLPIHVGLAVAHGLSEERAIHALTQGAADILGIGTNTGAVAPGKAANLIVCTDSPLQVQAGITHMFVRGQPVDLRNIHTENLARFQQRPAPALPAPRELVGPPSRTVR